MAKKKDASTGSVDASVLRRSGRETSSSRKQTTSSPVNTRKSERIGKHTSPTPSPDKNKPEKIEKQMGASPLRRSDRGKKSVEIPDLPNIKSTKEKTANSSKQSSEDVVKDKKIEKHDSDVGGKKRKRFTAIRYKALFKPQRIRIESDDDEDPEGDGKSPQAKTSSNDDVDRELKSQNSIRVQEASDEAYKALLEGRLIDLDQIEDDDCREIKPLDEKSIESGDVEKQIGGNFSPSDRNIADNENDIFHTSSSTINHDLENQQELDPCHKVTGTCKAAGIMENAENNDVTTNVQNSKFVEFWVPVQISNVQLEQYCATLLSNAMALRSCTKTDTLGALKDIFIANRKCCNYPYIVDPKLQKLLSDKDPTMLLDVGIKASGKLQFLDSILPEIKKRQLRVLILFQHTSGTLSGSPPLGQILVDYVHQRFGQDSYEHVDGFGNISSKKQAAINIFNKEMTRFIFLLESRACHPSIKLSSVDVIIIFDSDLNLSNDIRSLQKISIDSQSEQIMIFRLYSSSTLEEKILKLAEQNVAIDIRSQNLRSNYDALLTWGASELFDKLTEFHSQTVFNISSEESLLNDVVEEFLYIISHKCKNDDTPSKSSIIRVQNCGIYGKNVLLHSEIKTHLPNGDQPHVFWKKLLENRFPIWKFVSESTPRQRKRPSYFVDSPMGKSDVDGGGVKTRRKTVNNNNIIEPAQLKPVTEGETGGVKEGVPAADNEPQTSSGDRFWSTVVNDETSLLDQLKPIVSELCNILKFSEKVKVIVETFLEFVLENFNVGKEHTSALQAFMISLCWIGSSLAKNKTDRNESFDIAKKHFNFSCMEEEADSVYKKLKPAKEMFLQRTQILDRLKDCIPARQGVNLQAEKSQHIPNVDVSENHESVNEDVSTKEQDEFEQLNREWVEKRLSLEKDYNVDKSLIHALYSNPSIRSEKLKILEKEFANKFKEHERLREIWLKDRKATMPVAEGSLHGGSRHKTLVVHSGNAEVALTLPENPIEAKSHDEPVCEGANDIESTGSHTSEQMGEVAVQHYEDDLEGYMAETVDLVELGVLEVDLTQDNVKGATSSPDVSHAVEDHNVTGADDVAPHVNSGDSEMPAGHSNKENFEDGTICPHTSHDVDDRQEIIPDDVVLDVESAEMGTPAGIYDKEEAEEGEICSDRSDPGDEHNETSPNARVESAEMATLAGFCEKENLEDGEICPDTSDAEDGHNETSPNDVAPRVESAEMVTPACNEENSEDSIVSPDASHDGGEDHDDSCGSSNSNPPCAAVSQDKTPSVVAVAFPALNHSEPTIPEIQTESLQLEQFPDSGVQDVEVNVDHRQPSDNQLDRIMPDVQPDFPSSMVANNPSDTLPPNGMLLERTHEEPTVTEPQSVGNLEENLVDAVELSVEEHQTHLATSGAPTPLVNALNMFDNLINRVSSQMPNQTDPLQAEVERLYTVKDSVTKFHEDVKQRLNSECEKEIVEIIAQIKLKYKAKHQEADAAYQSKKKELETNINRVIMNRILAEAFRSKCQDLTPSGHPGMQQVSQAGLMQQLQRFSVSPSMRCFHGASSSSPGQSSGSQPPVPQPPSSLPQPPPPPLPLPPQQLQPQLRPRPPLQIVHQPAALFSSTPTRPPPPNTNFRTPSTTPIRPPSNTNHATSSTTPTRPPLIINQITPSTTPTISRPPSTVNKITPSSTPTTSRPPPGINAITISSKPNRSPPRINQIDMSAANQRINTETRGQSTHFRPLVNGEIRVPAPHMRPLVSNEPRAPAPHLRSMATGEIRAPAPHIRPFRSTPSVSPDVGKLRRMMPGQQHVTSGPSQSPVIPPVSTTSPQSLPPLPPEPHIMPPPPSEPYTMPPPPLPPSSDNLGLMDNAPRWVNVMTPQPDLISQIDRLDITEFIRDGTAHSSSGHDLVCLSDDD